ncbi:hypothetical protein [Amaricoccus solimangrovi]|uniref:Uncharacterized protein n=1 Tax=Amaricoccus solimangrovi TaxID=2589815 RepID=A0A501WY84_9RHOB|nr:hypothetical protein [Amaricoccus solimangrovi]TPE53225.1 hypothetical protein FJM51_04185 [Amaricoccus solimangrovi]
MPSKIESPAAGSTANGAEIESGSMTPYSTPTPKAATLSRLRSAHIATLCGLTDHRAAMIAALIFSEVAR